MSYISIWVHCVWTTKRRYPFITEDFRVQLVNHIRNYAREKGIFIDSVNGYSNHLHALISLGGSQNISELMRLIKGESSHWINKQKFTKFRFEWQDDFYAVSVDKDSLIKVRKYIFNQVIHHRKKSLEEELKTIDLGPDLLD